MDHQLIFEPADAFTQEEFSTWLDELEARQEQDADEFPDFVNRLFDEAAWDG